MSTELILFVLALIAGYLYLNREPEVVKQPVYRTQYVTEYVPVPVRRPYRRERFVPPRKNHRERDKKPRGFISGVGTPS